jgi:hypothetical protein
MYSTVKKTTWTHEKKLEKKGTGNISCTHVYRTSTHAKKFFKKKCTGKNILYSGSQVD